VVLGGVAMIGQKKGIRERNIRQRGRGGIKGSQVEDA